MSAAKKTNAKHRKMPCFPTEKVSKVTFTLFRLKNSHGLFRGYFSGKSG